MTHTCFFRSLRAQRISSLAALVVLSAASAAQSLPPTWQAQFDGPAHGSDFATSVAVMPSGDVAVGGTTWVAQPGTLVPQFFTALYSAQGQPLWSRMYGSGFSGGNGSVDQIAIAPGSKIVTAGTRNFGQDWMVVQYDAAGTQQWAGLWMAGSSFVSHVEDLDVDSAGNIYLCGDISAGAGVAKFSPAGALLWSRVYNGTGLALGSVRALAVTSAGEVFLTGSTSTGAGGARFSVARIDAANGAPLWVRQHGPASGFAYSSGMGLVTDAAGHAIAGARIENQPAAAYISFTSYAPDGTLVWSYDHVGATAITGYIEGMAIDAADNLAVAGWSYLGTPDIDGFVLRLNGSSFAWQRSIAGSAHVDDRAIGVGLDALGNVYAAGQFQDPALSLDVFMYGPSGSLLSHGRAPVPASGSGHARDMALGPAGRAYVVGDMASFPVTGGDAMTVAFNLIQPGSAYCSGDGTGTACPCGNTSAPGANEGCLDSFALGGKLVAIGNPSLSSDTFVLQGSQMPDSSVLYFQGTLLLGGGAGVSFGDGLRCAGGTIVRLAPTLNVGGASQYPETGEPSVSVQGLITAPGLRSYQVWYRNSAAFCSPAAFNLTNGWQANWTP